jgi:hypothetical protein
MSPSPGSSNTAVFCRGLLPLFADPVRGRRMLSLTFEVDRYSESLL